MFCCAVVSIPRLRGPEQTAIRHLRASADHGVVSGVPLQRPLNHVGHDILASLSVGGTSNWQFECGGRAFANPPQPVCVEMACQRAGLMRDTLLNATISKNAVGVLVDKFHIRLDVLGR